MTHHRDLMPPNPLTCAHEHPIPVVDNETREIIFWKCECGKSFDVRRFENKEEPKS